MKPDEMAAARRQAQPLAPAAAVQPSGA
jgi:hypothetical protein